MKPRPAKVEAPFLTDLDMAGTFQRQNNGKKLDPRASIETLGIMLKEAMPLPWENSKVLNVIKPFRPSINTSGESMVTRAEDTRMSAVHNYISKRVSLAPSMFLLAHDASKSTKHSTASNRHVGSPVKSLLLSQRSSFHRSAAYGVDLPLQYCGEFCWIQ
jgi:hypothetical protein